ncbi:MAG TPA: sensor histidine kinase [Chryseolinea sp.]|nr:sensor histidine kinase [Chryseolinea sp.]
MQRILIFVSLTFCITAGFSQDLILTDSGRLVVNNKMKYLRDESCQFSLEDVIKSPFHQLTEVKAPNFGFDNAAYWFKLDVVNRSNSPNWLLEINFSPLDKVDFYLQDDSGNWMHEKAGDMFPIVIRDVMYRHPVFSVNIRPASSRTAYLRVETSSSVQVPAILWRPDVFSRVSSHLQFINGLFYGAMVLMTLYHLFLFFSLRDRITLFYVMTLIAMTNIVSFFQGYNFLYLHPKHPYFNDLFAIFSGPAFILCSTLLTRAFLKLRQFSRWLDYALMINMLIDIVMGFAMLIFFRQISYKYHHYLILSHCIIAVISAWYCLSKRYRPARYYMVAWIAPFLAAATFTISNLGFVPGLLSMNYAGLMAGCILQTLFISFALGDRWNTLEKENQQAKEMELKRGQEENGRLEMEVELRTAKILQQNLQLEEVNNVKDKLFSVVSHDIKGPLSSLHLALTLAKSGSLNAQEFQHISSQLDQRLGQTTEFIDNLLQWAKLQMKGETFEPDKIDLSRLATESVNLLEHECKQKKIRLINNLNGPLEAFADINMVRSILRNLLTNATKFTPVEGSITISAYTIDNRIIISVADTGVGIPKSNLGRLFTLNSIATEGTQSEKGTGLGLLLCREFVEKNGGKIWFETIVGQGTTFYFSLPVYKASAQRLTSAGGQRM